MGNKSSYYLAGMLLHRGATGWQCRSTESSKTNRSAKTRLRVKFNSDFHLRNHDMEEWRLCTSPVDDNNIIKETKICVPVAKFGSNLGRFKRLHAIPKAFKMVCLD